MANKVTIHDIADVCGVSIATVSRVMNNSTFVREETRQRVLEAISRLGYTANETARSLRTQKRSLLGVIMSDITNPFFGNVLKGIDEAARERGYTLLFVNVDGSFDLELEYLSSMKERCATIILVTADFRAEHSLEIQRSRVPVVIASGRVSDPNVPCVGVDNAAAAFDMTRHLLELGHQRIALITGPSRDVLASEERVKGFRLALQGARVVIQQEYIQEGDFSVESGRQGMEALLSVRPRPTAVFCLNDEMAVGALQAIKSAGLDVPGDIAVAGFDGIPMAAVVDPPLTTIAQPRFEIGYQSALLAIALAEGTSPSSLKRTLPYELVIRPSTRPQAKEGWAQVSG
ncbi:MAG: LacI family DNA-binding transcriptional regulator [Bacillota bacterium]